MVKDAGLQDQIIQVNCTFARTAVVTTGTENEVCVCVCVTLLFFLGMYVCVIHICVCMMSAVVSLTMCVCLFVCYVDVLKLPESSVSCVVFVRICGVAGYKKGQENTETNSWWETKLIESEYSDGNVIKKA